MAAAIALRAMNGVALQASAPLICPGHSRPVAGIEFSAETEDGVFLISACHDKTAMIRSGETGDWIGTFEGHKGAVWGAALNAPATRAATGSGDFSAKVWDALTGDELLELKHRHIVRAVQWSPDSTNLVTGGKEAKLRLFDLNQPDAEPSMMLGHEANKAIKVVRYLPDPSGKVFLSAGDDKTLRVWDVRTLSEVRKLEFDGAVNSVELSRDEKTLTIAAGNEVRTPRAGSVHSYGSGRCASIELSRVLCRCCVSGLILGYELIHLHQEVQPRRRRGQRLRCQLGDLASRPQGLCCGWRQLLGLRARL